MENANMSLPVPETEKRSAMPEQELLPLKILQQQVCSRCDQYLTVLPIIISECNEDVMCGRHEDERDRDGTLSMLNKVMENYRFQCINHYEGCQELLNCTTSLEHEQECKVPKSACPFCPFSDNWSRLLSHISRKHPLNIIYNEPIQFKMKKRFSQTYVCSIDDCIYKVTVEIDSKTLMVAVESALQKEFIMEKMMINLSFGQVIINEYVILSRGLKKSVTKNLNHLGIDHDDYCQIHINQVQLTLNEIELSRESTSLYGRQSRNFDLALEKIDLLNSTIKEKEGTLKRIFNLTKYGFMRFECSGCNISITDSIFKCPNDHFLCEKCLHTVYIRHCSRCNIICEFLEIDNLCEIQKCCDWLGCGINTSLTKYIEHKRKCPQRQYICPDIGCARIFSLKMPKNHWHFHVLKTTISHSFLGDLSTKEFFLFHGSELYYISVKVEHQKNELVVEEIDVVDNRRYRIELHLFFSDNNRSIICPELGKYSNGKSVFSFTDEYSNYKLSFCSLNV